MREKMATWHWTAMLALLVFAVGGRAETVDAESIASRLSWFFSEMTITNETDILVRMMDHGVSFSAKDISGKGRGVQTIDGNGRMLLTEGDAYSFYVNWRGSDVMEVALTNAVDQSRLGNCLAKRKGMSVLVKLYAGSCRRDQGVTERNFIIDLAGERFYDVEKSYVGEFKMPFRSPWKNWDDFEENFSRRSKRDVKTECMALAARLAEGVRTCKGLEEFRNKLTNGETRVVLYQDEGHEYSITPVRLQKQGDEFVLLSGGWFCGSGDCSVCVFDDFRRLRWAFYRHGKCEAAYEFDENGEIGRFAEVDERGEVPPRRALLRKDGVMLGASERGAFIAAVRALVAPLADAWRNKDYISVYRKPQRKLTLEEERANAAIYEKFSRDEKARQEKYTRINGERLSKGLPELTKLDKRRIEQDEALELMRKDSATGERSPAANETGGQMRLCRERIPTVMHEEPIFYHAEKLYNFRYRRGRPQRLEDMLGAVNPGSDEPFMIDGDNYRQDLWGHPYRYYVGQGEQKSHRSNRAVIVSAGPDGVFDTADDLSSEDYFRLRKLASEKNAKK